MSVAGVALSGVTTGAADPVNGKSVVDVAPAPPVGVTNRLVVALDALGLSDPHAAKHNSASPTSNRFTE